MNELLVVLLIQVTILVGYSILSLLRINYQSVWLGIPCAFALGFGFISTELFLYSFFGINWNIMSMLFPVIIIMVLTRFWKYSWYLHFKKIPHIDRINMFFLILIIGLVFFVGFESILRPVSAWDGWASWLLKAKMFYIDGAVHPSQFLYSESEYPPYLSMYISFLYIGIGKVDDKAVLLLYPFFYIFLIMSFYYALRLRMNMGRALLGTFLLASTQNIIRHSGRFEAGQADLPLAFFMFMSFISLTHFLKDKNINSLWVLEIILGIIALIKNEGIPFVLCIQIILLITFLRSKAYGRTLSLIVGFIPIVFWGLYKILNDFPSNYLFTNTQVEMGRVGVILVGFVTEFINIQNWNILWVGFFIALNLVLFRSRKWDLSFTLVLFQLLVYAGIFLLTPIDPAAHIKNVIDRLYIHISPLAVYAISVTLLPLFMVYDKYNHNR